MHHFALPLTLGADGSFTSLVDDSGDEVTQSVQLLLSTRVGERRAEPLWGSVDPRLLAPIQDSATGELLQGADTGAIAALESRAVDRVDVTVLSATP